MWTVPEPKGITRTAAFEAEKLKLVSEGCDPKLVSIFNAVFITCVSIAAFYDLFVCSSWMRRK